MLKKLPMVVLLIILCYLLLPVCLICSSFGIKIENVLQLYEIVLIVTYFFAFIDLYLLYKNCDAFRIIKFSLIGKLSFFPIILILIITGFLLLIAIIGSAFILVGLELLLFVMILTSLYSSIGIYVYHKQNNLKLKKFWIILQWIFPIDILSLVLFFIKIKTDDLKVKK